MAALVASILLPPATMAQSELTRADASLFVGQRVYVDFCASCHGRDAAGSPFAPDLLARIDRMNLSGFTELLAEGYPGIENAPPPWGSNPEVERYSRELWGYLAELLRERSNAGSSGGSVTERAE